MMSNMAPLQLILFIFVPLLPLPHVSAQQSYPPSEFTMDCGNYHPENAGYLCEPSMPRCQTLAYFRAQPGPYDTLSTIASLLFNTTPSDIASVSALSPNAALTPWEGLFIPLDCRCHGNHSHHDVAYWISPGDAFYKMGNVTYQGLTTCQAIQEANPSADATKLVVGQRVVIPIRCACPSPQQLLQGIRMLLTYPVGSFEDVSAVVTKFGINTQEFVDANMLPNDTQKLFPAITVLVPFHAKPIIPPNPPMVQNPSPSSGGSIATSPSSHGRSRTGVFIGIIAAVIIIAMSLILIGAFIAIKRRRASKERLISSKILPYLRNRKLQQDLHDGMSAFASFEKLAIYSLDEIRKATQDFSPTNLIKGAVYRGVINGQVVAVKNMTRNVTKELQILQKVHHANLVTLLGVCNIESPEISYLIYEYAENGSLSDWLHENDFSMSSSGSSVCNLTWNNRLQIALDVATALEYIHDHTKPSYVHKDIKSSNILLDSKFRAKIANFGLAKLAEEASQTRHIIGTQGYLAPEYVIDGIVSTKTDVFAFGVVLLEMLSGEEATMRDKVGKERFLSEAMEGVLSSDGNKSAKDKLKGWMDPRLQNAFPLDCAYSVANLARSCVAIDPSARPNAGELAFALTKLLELSLEWEPSGDMDPPHPPEAR